MAGTAIGVSPRLTAGVNPTIFQQDFFLARRKILFCPYGTFGPERRDAGLCAPKVFAVRDDVRIFTDQTQSFELRLISENAHVIADGKDSGAQRPASLRSGPKCKAWAKEKILRRARKKSCWKMVGLISAVSLGLTPIAVPAIR